MNKIQIMENAASIQWMNNQIMDIGNEDAEEIWLYTYPDGADYDDILEMAKDEKMMGYLHDTYKRIMEYHYAGML